MENRYENLDFDIIVIGGGPAGTVAAIAAARNGAKVLLIERHGFLGGMLTAGGTGPMMSFHAGTKQVVMGIPQEIVMRMEALGFSPGHMEDFVGYCGSVTPFSPEGMKLILEDMCIESGVTLLYHTNFVDCKMEEDKITSVRLFAKNGFFEARAKIFIDASADADLSVAAGVSTVFGREEDHLAQPMSMNILVGGVDREKVMDYVLANQDDMLPTIPFDHLRLIARSGIQGGNRFLQKLRFEGKTTIPNSHFLCFETNTLGQYIINMTHVLEKSSVDAFDLTFAEIDGRKQAHETFITFKKYVPGFENAYLISTGPNIGIRESRKIDGLYKLTAEDLVNSVMFHDAVAMGGYPIDVHNPEGKGTTTMPKLKAGSWYSIPYRCLVTDKVRNLVVAGRCISTTHQACGATRVTPILMAIAQGAGTAAAIAANENIHVMDVDTVKLRTLLLKDGAFLEEYSE